MRLKITLILLMFLNFIPNMAQQREGRLVRTTDYLVTLPLKYDTVSLKKWPILVFLHGNNPNPTLDMVKHDFMTVFAERNEDFPIILVSPVNQYENWNIDVLNDLLDDVIGKYEVDENRIYLSGHSLGGHGVYEWALESPERFAAVVPISGCTDLYDSKEMKKPWKLRHTPVWIFHGENDALADVNCNINAANELRKFSKKVKLTIYPKTGHDTWVIPFEHDGVHRWMLDQKRDGNLVDRVKLDSETRKAYCGRYEFEVNPLRKDFIEIYHEDGCLYLKFNNGKPVPLYADTETRFSLKTMPAYGVEFMFDNETISGLQMLHERNPFFKRTE
ncbi:prolyl oligopeptidase family serine peptidase [Ulvibacterium sp.]|uniref:carboxylesterase family protein n=1 Tax=Ulvibacterium sp. TaxID=2665914 RepID=UPI003BACC035